MRRCTEVTGGVVLRRVGRGSGWEFRKGNRRAGSGKLPLSATTVRPRRRGTRRQKTTQQHREQAATQTLARDTGQEHHPGITTCPAMCLMLRT